MVESFFTKKNLVDAMHKAGKVPRNRIIGLVKALSMESIEYIDATDLEILRGLITSEISKIGAKHPDVVAEQVAMVIIGTLRMQVRNEGNVSWDIANNAIDALLAGSRRPTFKKYYLAVIAAAVGLVSYQFFLLPEIATKGIEIDKLAISPIDPSIPSPYVPSHFYSMRENMEKMKCQFPQAMMLPEDQRSAFLTFIQSGEIALNELTQLQLALAKVHCTYPALTMPPAGLGKKSYE